MKKIIKKTCKLIFYLYLCSTQTFIIMSTEIMTLELKTLSNNEALALWQVADDLKRLLSEFDSVEKVTSELQVDAMKESAELHKKFVALRKQCEKTHKEVKEQYLNTGRLIDGFKNKVIAFCNEKEVFLTANKNFLVNLSEKETQRKRQERHSLLLPFVGYFDLKGLDLGLLQEATFDAILESAKKKKQAESDLSTQRFLEILPFLKNLPANTDEKNLGKLSEKDYSAVLETAEKNSEKGLFRTEGELSITHLDIARLKKLSEVMSSPARISLESEDAKNLFAKIDSRLRELGQELLTLIELKDYHLNDIS